MAGVALVLAALLLLVAVRPTTGASTGFLVTAAAVPILWMAIGFVLGEVWPGLYEQVAVHPNQLAAERPYIDNNIVSTRASDGPRPHRSARPDRRRHARRGRAGAQSARAGRRAHHRLAAADGRLQPAAADPPVLRVLATSTSTATTLRGGPQQVMLATRELDPTSLAQVARTWQNTHLVYTHGQGVVVSPVNQVDSAGLAAAPRAGHSGDDRRAGADHRRAPACTSACGPRTTPSSAPGSTSSTGPATTPTAEIRTRYAGGGGVARRRGPRATGHGRGHRRRQPPAQQRRQRRFAAPAPPPDPGAHRPRRAVPATGQRPVPGHPRRTPAVGPGRLHLDQSLSRRHPAGRRRTTCATASR